MWSEGEHGNTLRLQIIRSARHHASDGRAGNRVEAGHWSIVRHSCPVPLRCISGWRIPGGLGLRNSSERWTNVLWRPDRHRRRLAVMSKEPIGERPCAGDRAGTQTSGQGQSRRQNGSSHELTHGSDSSNIAHNRSRSKREQSIWNWWIRKLSHSGDHDRYATLSRN